MLSIDYFDGSAKGFGRIDDKAVFAYRLLWASWGEFYYDDRELKIYKLTPVANRQWESVETAAKQSGALLPSGHIGFHLLSQAKQAHLNVALNLADSFWDFEPKVLLAGSDIEDSDAMVSRVESNKTQLDALLSRESSIPEWLALMRSWKMDLADLEKYK